MLLSPAQTRRLMPLTLLFASMLTPSSASALERVTAQPQQATEVSRAASPGLHRSYLKTRVRGRNLDGAPITRADEEISHDLHWVCGLALAENASGYTVECNFYSYVGSNPIAFVDPEGEYGKIASLMGEAKRVADLVTGYAHGATRAPVALGGLVSVLIGTETWENYQWTLAEWDKAAQNLPNEAVEIGKHHGVIVSTWGVPGPKGEQGTVNLLAKKPPLRLPAEWCQYSQRWRDPVTGRYVTGPVPAKDMAAGGTGKPSKWIAESKDVTDDMLRMRDATRIYEKTRSSQEAQNLLDALEHWAKTRTGL